MAYREGLGRILTLGVREAAGTIGRGVEKDSPLVKGLELAVWHPRSIMGTGPGYAVSNRGD